MIAFSCQRHLEPLLPFQQVYTKLLELRHSGKLPKPFSITCSARVAVTMQQQEPIQQTVSVVINLSSAE